MVSTDLHIYMYVSTVIYECCMCWSDLIWYIHSIRFRIAAVYSNNDNKLGPNSARFYLHKGPLYNKNPLSPPVLMHTEAVSPTAIEICWQVCAL
jgi:hypothetical protein